MEESNSDALGGGAIIEHENGAIPTNLQRSRSIPEPISDSHDIHNSGTDQAYIVFNGLLRIYTKVKI